MSKYLIIPKNVNASSRVIDADKMNQSWKDNSNTVTLYQESEIVAVVSMDSALCVLKMPEQGAQ